MCRSKESGGRRCPQHTDPIKHAAYNKHRREQYALKKQSIVNLALMFPAFDEVKYSLENDSNLLRRQHRLEAEAFEAQLRAGFIQARNQALANPDQETSNWDEEYQKRQDRFESLNWYTTSGYNFVRDYLNKDQLAPYKSKFNPDEAANAERFIPILDEALSQAVPPEKPRVLYRGITLPHGVDEAETETWLNNNFPIGGVISQKSYMSTTFSGYMAIDTFSKDHEREESFVFEIVSRKGAALGVDSSSWGLEESEVLMPRDAKFKVVSVHRNQDLKVRWSPESRDATSISKRTIIRLIDAEEE